MNKVFVDKKKKYKRTLSVSQIQTFTRCRRSWYYSYKKEIVPIKDHAYLVKGLLVHKGMEAAWMSKYKAGQIISDQDMIDAGVKSMKEWYESFMEKNADSMGSLTFMEEVEQTYSDSIEIFRRSLSLFKPTEWEVIEVDDAPCVEVHYAVPLKVSEGSKTIGMMHGYIDLIAKHMPTNQIWQIDWKVKSTLSPSEDEMYNIQNVAYCMATQLAGIDIVGSITFQMLGLAGTMPNLNKNGTVSRAAIRCTWEDYAQFCVDNGQDPGEYEEEMRPKLDKTEWVRENKEYKSWPVIVKMWKDVVIETYKDIKKERRYLPSISSMNCKSCSYGALCHADLRGYDTEFILENEFTKKGGREDE